ncbi:hypothetical protein JRQ81_012227, partial [Phrynocephalus forsythii]
RSLFPGGGILVSLPGLGAWRSSQRRLLCISPCGARRLPGSCPQKSWKKRPVRLWTVSKRTSWKCRIEVRHVGCPGKDKSAETGKSRGRKQNQIPQGRIHPRRLWAMIPTRSRVMKKTRN